MSKLLVIENCNFKDYPTGGTLSFAKQLINALPKEKLSLVGITTENLQIGEWSKIEISGQPIDFFPILRLNPNDKKPLIPLRIKSFLALLYYLKTIRKKSYRIVFTQTPQFIFALSFFEWDSLCFCFAGLGNSVKLSRYKSLRFMGGIYENLLLSLLDKNAECIYAASDSISIQDFKLKHNSILKKEIISLPTRFDEVIFSPREMKSTREKLNLPQNKTILVTTGRLCWVKGWDLLLEVIKNRNEIDQALLIFVGDGEDRKQIEEKYPGLINNTILITGFVDSQTVSDYINSADVFILGSYTEGWSTSLIEALACGKPIVTTNVSSAFDIVNEGVNGFIVKERSHSIFNKRISDALELKDVVVASGQMALKFKKSTLYEDFTKNWEAGKILFQ